MRKIIALIISSLLIFISSCSVLKPHFTDNRFSYALKMNGYWNDWKMPYIENLDKINFYNSGDICYFILYNGYNHPSKYSVKVSYNQNSERKEDSWYIYEGTVEYYVENKSDNFYFEKWPTHWPLSADSSSGYRKISNAKIQISCKASKAHKGSAINVFFEGNAIAISGV